MDSSLHLVPGRYKPPTAPGGSLRKDSPGWENAENKFTATSGLPACVCVLCRLHICTCVFQCVVCAIKNLTKVLIIILLLIMELISLSLSLSPSLSLSQSHTHTH